MDDLELFHAGDRVVFRDLIREHGPHVLGLARSFARNGTDAEDLFQDIWLRVYQRRAQYEGRGAFAGWVMTVARNECLSRYRHDQVRRGTRETLQHSGSHEELVSSSADPSAAAERAERRRRLCEALEHLTERQRTAITLRIFEDRDSTEAAAIMKCEPATVRSLMRNGLTRLRAVLNGGADHDDMP